MRHSNITSASVVSGNTIVRAFTADTYVFVTVRTDSVDVQIAVQRKETDENRQLMLTSR